MGNVLDLKPKLESKLCRELSVSVRLAKAHPGKSSSELRELARAELHAKRQQRAKDAQQLFVARAGLALAAVFADPMLLDRITHFAPGAAATLEAARLALRDLEQAVDNAAADTSGLDSLIELAEDSTDPRRGA